MKRQTVRILICLGLSLIGGVVFADGGSDFGRDASWDYPTAKQLKSELDVWVAEYDLDAAITAQISDLWESDLDPSVDETRPDEARPDEARRETNQAASDTLAAREMDRHELSMRVLRTIRLVEPESIPFVDACFTAQSDVGRFSVPGTVLLQNQSTPAIVRDNLRLLIGGWLADHQLYDEALVQLDPIDLGNVADPAKLLFYTAASHYRLRNRERGLEAVNKLLERSGDIPRRYDTVAQLMQSDLKALKADSLDEVSRIMTSITVRLGHGRAGKRVRGEEDDVVRKLDKMIEELEKKRQQQQQQQGQDSKGGKQSSRPMQNSNPAGGKGPGNVDPKRIADDIDWGNLPAKEREEALQRLGTEFPSHYREVIEEYFRRLARKEAETP